MATHQLYNAYWTTEDHHISTLLIRNVHREDMTTVSTTLHRPDGRRMRLPDRVIPPLTTVAVDIGDELALLNESQGHGNAHFTYSHANRGVLLAEIVVENPQSTISYTVPSYDYEGATESLKSTRHLYGMYRLPTPATELYIALQNVSSTPLVVTPRLMTSEGSLALGERVIPPWGASVFEMPEDLPPQSRGLWSQRTHGTVVLEHAGPVGALNAIGWLEDEKTGFATSMTFADPTAAQSTSLYGAQIFLRDPMRGNARVRSYLVLQNTTQATIPLSGEVILETATGPVTVPFPVNAIDAGGPVEVSFERLLGAIGDATTAAVRLNYVGPPGAVVGRTYGVGGDPTFGYYSALEPRAHPIYGGIHWRVSRTVDTLLSLVNFGEGEDQITVQLFHHDGVITIPSVALGRLESRTISLRTALAGLGVSVPTSGLTGGYRVSGGRSTQSAVLTKQTTIDIEAGTAVPMYGGPPYVLQLFVDPDQFYLVGDNDSETFQCFLVYSDNSHYPHSCGTATSSDDSVAFADTSGSSGTVFGGQPGVTFIDLESSYLDQFGTRQQLQYQMRAAVCNFTIVPGQFNSSYCQNPVLQERQFSADVRPSLSECILTSSQSSCSVAHFEGNTVQLHVANPYTCNIEPFSVTGRARFYGPGAGEAAGALQLGFSLRLRGKTLSKTRTIEVVCP